MNTHRFENQVACVTGGGSGIGQAIARRLAEEGAHVFVLELSSQQAAATVESIRSTGGRVDMLVADVSDTAAMEAAFAQLPSLNVLVNSAGIAHIGSLEKTSAADMDRLYNVNVKGVYHGMYFGVPRLLATAGNRVILNLASIASKIALADRFAYSMTKGAVLAMTLSVARDYVTQGIRCNALCPARVHTPFVDNFLAQNYAGKEKEMFEKLSAAQPIGRMGLPHEIAALAAFLASEEAGFITGSAYDIDGGATLLR